MSERIDDRQYILHYKVYKGIMLFRWDPLKNPYKKDIFYDYHASYGTIDINEDDIFIHESSEFWQSPYLKLPVDGNIQANDDFTIYCRIKIPTPMTYNYYSIIYDGLSMNSDYQSQFYNYGFQLLIEDYYRLRFYHGIIDYEMNTPLIDVDASSIMDKEYHHIAVTRYKGTLRAFIDGKKVYDSGTTKNYDTYFIPTGNYSLSQLNDYWIPDIVIGSYSTSEFYLSDLMVYKNYAAYRNNDFDSFVPVDYLDPYPISRNITNTAKIFVKLNVQGHKAFKTATSVQYSKVFSYPTIVNFNFDNLKIFLQTEREIKLENIKLKSDLKYEYLLNLTKEYSVYRDIRYKNMTLVTETNRDLRTTLEHKQYTERNVEIGNNEYPIYDQPLIRTVMYTLTSNTDTYLFTFVNIDKEQYNYTLRHIEKTVKYYQDTYLNNTIGSENKPINISYSIRDIRMNIFDKVDGIPGWKTRRNLLTKYGNIPESTKRNIVYGLDQYGKNPHIKPWNTLRNISKGTKNAIPIGTTSRNVLETWYLITPTNLIKLITTITNTKKSVINNIIVKYSTRRYIKKYTSKSVAFICNPHIKLIKPNLLNYINF